ncbi:hypothetical protein HK405_001116 [Cladochytrium tenue]|nr:hypothetical protein HK405_001116 [Cladochytrium tenue]
MSAANLTSNAHTHEPHTSSNYVRRRRHRRVAKALPPPKDLLGYLSRYKPSAAAVLVAEKFHLGYTHDRSNNLKAFCPGCRRANISIKTVKLLVDQLDAGVDCSFQCRGGSCDFALELSLKPRAEDVSAEDASAPATDAQSSVGMCTSDYTTDLDFFKLLSLVANSAEDGQEQPVVSLQQQMILAPYTGEGGGAGVTDLDNQMWSTSDSHHPTNSDRLSWLSSSGDGSAISTPASSLSATAQLPPASEDRPILDGEFKLSNMLLGRTKFTFLVGGPTSYVVHPPQLSVEIHANMKLSFRICHAELPDGTIDRKVHDDHAFSDEISVRATNAHGTVDAHLLVPLQAPPVVLRFSVRGGSGGAIGGMAHGEYPARIVFYAPVTASPQNPLIGSITVRAVNNTVVCS